MGQEKRRFIRWTKKVRVVCSVREDEEAFEEIFAEDISESGLQIVLRRPLKANQCIKLKLEFIYDSVPIMLTGKVVHVKPEGDRFRMGLEFVYMDDFQRQRLRKCLEKFSEELKGK